MTKEEIKEAWMKVQEAAYGLFEVDGNDYNTFLENRIEYPNIKVTDAVIDDGYGQGEWSIYYKEFCWELDGYKFKCTNRSKREGCLAWMDEDFGFFKIERLI